MRIFVVMTLIISMSYTCVFGMGTPPSVSKSGPTDATTKASSYAPSAEVKAEEPVEQVILGKRILMILPGKDFRDKEYLVPRTIFERYGAKVTVASSTKAIATGTDGTSVTPDITLDKVLVKNYDAFVYVGGPGAEQYYNDRTAHAIASEAVWYRKPVAAICMAPVILARSGILSGIKATVWSGEAAKIKDEGAIYTGADVVVFGSIITANGPDASEKFANAVVDKLKK